MLLLVLGLVCVVLFIQGVMGKKIMIGKKGIWLEDKKPKKPN